MSVNLISQSNNLQIIVDSNKAQLRILNPGYKLMSFQQKCQPNRTKLLKKMNDFTVICLVFQS